jgi:hypothetical protein
MWWPGLEEQLNAIRNEERQPDTELQREPIDMIEELLEITRGIQRRLLSSETAEAAKEPSSSNRVTMERIARERVRLLEDLIFAKLDAAFASSHEVRFQTNVSSEGRLLLDAVISPVEAGEELYLIELKYASNSKALLNRIVDGAAKLAIARRTYREHASGTIRCIILFVLQDQDESLMRLLESQLGALPDEVEAIGMYESELRQITPSDLRERLTATANHSDPS